MKKADLSTVDIAPLPAISRIANTPSKTKQKLESNRAAKKTQRLVVFPEAEVETSPSQAATDDEIWDEFRFLSTEQHYLEPNLRRVTAYLTTESFRFEEIQNQHSKNFTGKFKDIKRYDEVLYATYYAEPSFVLDQQTGLVEAVASEAPIGEVFIFDYGAVVIWGLDEAGERGLLFDLQPYELERLSPDDVERENFHFCHNPEKPPRLFNDIINLRSGHHMVKLTISHALAQSVKLTYFEELIENTILHTRNIPYELSSTGTIKMSRKDINKQIGELFAMRMNVNLVSNVLDTPELFWSYPSLGPLYRAVRGYREISPRAEVLNQRCAVLSDMLDMLRDHANIMHGETLEWIVILLIALEIFIGLIEALIDVHYGRRAAA